MNRISRALAGIIAMVGIMFGLSACNLNDGSGSGAYYDTLCVNPLTQIREPDYYCAVGNPYYNPHWIYYVPAGYSAPAYGVHIVHYNAHSFSRPRNATIHTGGVPSTGGKATKFSTGNTTVKGGSVSRTTRGTTRGGSIGTRRGTGGFGGSRNSGKRH